MNLGDDDFTLFDLPRRYALERSVLDQRWRALQSEVHPDRFAAEGASAQRLAMQWAVRVNEAHQRLKDPIARGAYLCELAGSDIAVQNNTAMPSAFLMQQMAWREALDEAADAPQIQSLADEVAARERALLADLHRQIDIDGDPAAAAQTVRALMFVHRFADDVGRRLDVLEA